MPAHTRPARSRPATRSSARAHRPSTPLCIAASVADRLPLLPGRIRTSPQAAGLTGAVSWFWLDPAPTVEELTVTLAGETVTVTAEPSVDRVAPRRRHQTRWEAPGCPTAPARRRTGAIVHLYETRCLPGDQGRNPYVLGSCGSNGYPLEAVVTWRISFTASGPIDTRGSLPARTTATEAPYPGERGACLPRRREGRSDRVPARTWIRRWCRVRLGGRGLRIRAPVRIAAV